MKTFIVAEAGINAGGNINTALEMVREAKLAGADGIKFQLYIAEILCVDRDNHDNFDILKRNQIYPRWLPELYDECHRKGIEFMCTPFCKSTVEELNPFVKRFKIASPEVTNMKFLKVVAAYGKPMILSTGKVIDKDLDTIFSEISNEITLLYCISKYPAIPTDYDLSEISRLRKKYHCKVGISDHTIGIKTAIDAVQYQHADIVEKHFCISKKCADSAVSILPTEFNKMSDIIRSL